MPAAEKKTKEVLFFGTYDVTTTPRVQVLIDGLRNNGVPVTECNVPLRLSTAQRVKIAQQPWRLPILALHLLACWTRLCVKAWRYRKSKTVIVGYLGHFDVRLARLIFRKASIGLDYLISGSDTTKDRRVNSGQGFKERLLIAVDNGALKSADVVIVDTEEHLKALPSVFQDRAIVVDVGATDEWFRIGESASPDVHRPLRIVFFGKFTPLQGTPIIGEALSLITQPMEVTMAGSGQDEAETKRLAQNSTASITWTKWIDGKGVVEHDVCLGIFGTTPKAQRVVPNKVYQGAALGCAIVTSDTKPQQRLLGKNAVLIPVGDAQTLATVLDNLTRNPEEVTRLRQAARQLALHSFTPQQIVKPLVDRLSL